MESRRDRYLQDLKEHPLSSQTRAQHRISSVAAFASPEIADELIEQGFNGMLIVEPV